MNGLNWLLLSWKGRLGRKDYWLASLMIVVGSLAPTLLRLVNIKVFEIIDPQLWFQSYFLVMLGPLLSLQVKRWHDRDKPAWYLLLNLVPVIGSIWVFIATYCMPGDKDENRYGKNPAPDVIEDDIVYSINTALKLIDPYVEKRLPFALSLQNQLEWCRLTLTGFSPPPPSGPLNLAEIARNTFDQWQKQEALVEHLNKVQTAMKDVVLQAFIASQQSPVNTVSASENPEQTATAEATGTLL
ncbi:MAG: DUF805 domain-containing protein [Pseudomonadales bacterium]|nr:DUF805 domain-containing protein [Pseudomonadales bacterium]